MTVAAATEVRFAVLHHRNFTLLWSGLLVSNVRDMDAERGAGLASVAADQLAIVARLIGLELCYPDDRLSAVGRRCSRSSEPHPLVVFTQTGQMLVAFALSPSLGWASCSCSSRRVFDRFGTIIATFIQMATPNELRGRVMSLYAITLIGLPALGSLATGSLAEVLGGVSGAPRAVLLGALVLGVVLMAVSPFFWQRSMSAHVPGTPDRAPGPLGAGG